LGLITLSGLPEFFPFRPPDRTALLRQHTFSSGPDELNRAHWNQKSQTENETAPSDWSSPSGRIRQGVGFWRRDVATYFERLCVKDTPVTLEEAEMDCSGDSRFRLASGPRFTGIENEIARVFFRSSPGVPCRRDRRTRA